MIRLTALAFALFASPAVAQDMDILSIGQASGGPFGQVARTTVVLQPTSTHGAIAEIIFDNMDVNDDGDDGTYPLAVVGISVEITFTWDAIGGADMISVAVPEGLTAYPPDIAIPEYSTGKILIFAGEHFGM